MQDDGRLDESGVGKIVIERSLTQNHPSTIHAHRIGGARLVLDIDVVAIRGTRGRIDRGHYMSWSLTRESIDPLTQPGDIERAMLGANGDIVQLPVKDREHAGQGLHDP